FLLAAGCGIVPATANIAVIAEVSGTLLLCLFFKNVFRFWWNTIGGVNTLLTGAALSLLLPAPAAIRQGQTPVPNPRSPWHESAALLIFFVCMLAFCLLLPRMF